MRNDKQTIATRLCRHLKDVSASGYSREITFGVIRDETHSAYVECRRKETNGYVETTFELKFVEGEQVVWSWEFECYNPYFGCDVEWMRWLGDAVALIYREKHHWMLAVVPRRGHGDAKLVQIEQPYHFNNAEQILYFPERNQSFLLGVTLPELQPCGPIPSAWLPQQKPLPTRSQSVLQGDVRPLQQALLERCFGDHPPQPLADLLIGSFASACWSRVPHTGSTYHEATRWIGERPHWLPLFWFMILPGPAEAEFLNVLDQLAAMPTQDLEPDWTARECLCESVAVLVREQAARLTTACRGRRLPRGISYFFWYGERGLEEFERELALYPAGFQEAYQRLRPERETFSTWCEEDRKRR